MTEQPAETYTTAEVDALTERAGALMDQLRAVFGEIRLAVAEIVGEANPNAPAGVPAHSDAGPDDADGARAQPAG